MDIDDFLDKEGKGKAQDGEHKDRPESPAEPPPQEALLTQIEHIKSLLTDKKFDTAEKRYMDVREAFTKWTREHTEQQNRIYAALVNVNKEMVNALNTMRQETERNILRIYELLGKTQEHMNKNEMDVANQLFSEIESIFRNLSDLVPDKKAKLEHDLSSVRVALRSRSHVAATAEFQSIFKNIHNMLMYAFELVNRGKMQEALQYYHKVNSMYDALPQGFLYEKALLYQQILKLNQSVTSVSAKEPEPVQQPTGEKKNIFGKPIKS